MGKYWYAIVTIAVFMSVQSIGANDVNPMIQQKVEKALHSLWSAVARGDADVVEQKISYEGMVEAFMSAKFRLHPGRAVDEDVFGSLEEKKESFTKRVISLLRGYLSRLLAEKQLRDMFKHPLSIEKITLCPGKELRVAVVDRNPGKKKNVRHMVLRMRIHNDDIMIKATSLYAELGYYAFVVGKFIEDPVEQCHWGQNIIAPTVTLLLMGLDGPDCFFKRMIFAVTEAKWSEPWLVYCPQYVRGIRVFLGSTVDFLESPNTLSQVRSARPDLQVSLGLLYCYFGMDHGVDMLIRNKQLFTNSFGHEHISPHIEACLGVIRADPEPQSIRSPEDIWGIIKRCEGKTFRERLSTALQSKRIKQRKNVSGEWKRILVLGSAMGVKGAAEECWKNIGENRLSSAEESDRKTTMVKWERLQFMYICHENMKESFLRDKGYYPCIKSTKCPVALCKMILRLLEKANDPRLISMLCYEASLCGMPMAWGLGCPGKEERARRINTIRKWLKGHAKFCATPK